MWLLSALGVSGDTVMSQQYIGVYATKERSPSIGDFPRPLNMRKRLWFVWETIDGGYKAQALNAALQPMSEPAVITAKEFSSRFTYETGCLLAPEGSSHPDVKDMDASAASLPDLFLSDQEGSLATPSTLPGKTDGLQANDPNLLFSWAKSESKVKFQTTDPIKIPFDRLVSEVESPEEDNVSIVQARVEPVRASTPESKEETQQVRQLRSRFVQALLLLRRGARAESLALLEDMLVQHYEPFEGSAQVFSELGLGLRRLGFIHMALTAHKRALDFAPQNERILFNIARSYHDLDILPEAKDYLEKALAVAPDFAAARQFLMFIGSDKPGKMEK